MLTKTMVGYEDGFRFVEREMVIETYILLPVVVGIKCIYLANLVLLIFSYKVQIG